jgi:hypothetical protein
VGEWRYTSTILDLGKAGDRKIAIVGTITRKRLVID